MSLLKGLACVIQARNLEIIYDSSLCQPEVNILRINEV